MARTRAAEEWTRDVVARFWDHFAQRPNRCYFSETYGKALVLLLEQSGARSGYALDYGCGPGFLAEQLVAAGFRCSGVDSSERSVAACNSRCAGTPGWLGATRVSNASTEFEDGTFDTVCCVETLEHLPEAQVLIVLKELWRLLKPGGVGLLSVPNDENLQESMVYCPFCDAEFHQMQHLRAYESKGLRRILTDAGFHVALCTGLDLGRLQNLPHSVIREHGRLRLRWCASWLWRSLGDYLRPLPFPFGRRFAILASPGPHLCALVRKPIDV